jgi:hypothetical protein
MSPIVAELWTEAAMEAATLAPSGDAILHTIELRHPSFMDEANNPTAVRCVMDHGSLLQIGDPDIYGHMLTLEADAPVNAGQSVAFVACMFDMSLPSQHDNPPSIELALDNVTQIISERLDAAVGTQAAIEVTYREYLHSDHSKPQYVLGGGVLQSVVSTLNRVRGTIIFTDFVNRNFPALVYTPDEYVGLRK